MKTVYIFFFEIMNIFLNIDFVNCVRFRMSMYLLVLLMWMRLVWIPSAPAWPEAWYRQLKVRSGCLEKFARLFQGARPQG